ncbi:MAG TPA: DUF3180 domain-containing protein [Terrimesophilobacter sp.]|nr:DUF3180 domain-containing protein [Terrimesophilobacter sp.]HRQ00463.1 DUF3180 domain-containing protein [Terrimesophilobacter sp.]
MTRTRVGVVVLLAAVGLVVGALAELALSASGLPIVVPPLTFALTLGVVGVLVIALAWPVRRATRVEGATTIDPFYATRVLVFAKASALTGALLLGAGLGALVFLVTRPIIGVGSVAIVGASVLGAIVLLAGGLIGEHFCRANPPDDDEPDGTEPATPAHH